jgi:very-short-patch-repair endonuclease
MQTDLTAQQAMLAASLSARGPVSHRSAAWLWGIVDDLPQAVDVSVRSPRSATLRAPAQAHRIKDLAPDHWLRRQGLDLTNPMRTIVDLGLVVRWTEVDAALGRAIATRLLPLSAVVALREALARRGRNGVGVVQRVFDERLLRGADEDSRLELRLLRLARRFGLPPFALQYEVWHDGRFVARPDAVYPERRVAIEVDGYEFHSDPDAFQRDRERQNELVRLGWVVLRFTRFDLLRRPEYVASAIRAVL